MPARWGLGPVFAVEFLTAARRWQTYALRVVFAGLLFAALVIVWVNKAAPVIHGAAVLDRTTYARVGEAIFYAFFGTLLSATLLVAPGATAGAVCLDKARGTLLHLLVTDLSSAEIVLGKLAARLLPVLGLIACSVPVLSLCLWLGGIDPDAMLVAYAVTAGIALLGSTLALVLSVWGRKTHEVLLATYLVEILLLLAYPIGLSLDGLWGRAVLAPYLTWTNPYLLAFAPYLYRGPTDWTDLATFLGVCGGAAAAGAGLAVGRVRPVTVRQASQPPRRPRPRRTPRWLGWLRWPQWFAPKLDPNPVLWREWHRQRPSRWVQWVWAVYVLGAAAATGILVYLHWSAGFPPYGPGRSRSYEALAAFTTALQASVGLLLASVAAVTSLAEERVRGSLDLLLATPLPTRAIVWGKWRGAFRLVPRLALLPVLNVLAVARGDVRGTAVPLMAAVMLTYGAAVTSLGLACATWVRRLGRAVGASVLVYALITAGWLAAVQAVYHSDHETFERLGLASPFFGPGELAFESTTDYRPPGADWPRCYRPLLFWTGFFAATAFGLYLAVLATFDRCLGRVSERSRAVRWWGGGRGVIPPPHHLTAPPPHHPSLPPAPTARRPAPRR